MTLDPLITRTIGTGLGLMFVFAGVHKLRSNASFRDTLREYRLLAESMLAPLAVALPLAELLLGIALLAGGAARVPGAIGAALLLGVYSAAIGINVARGRVHFDCGCSFGGKGEREQFLSYGLMLRNLLLLFAAAAMLLPQAARTLRATDFLLLCAGLLAATLLFAAGNQLLANGAAINTWRNKRA